jgi:serine/threonine protein phosphatase 1
MTAFCQNPYLFVKKNEQGRDFVVGDIHGCYDLVLKALKTVGFDYSKDRLFCVGDLIDRGPDSYRALRFLSHDWVYSIRGNHEDMLLELYQDTDTPPDALIQYVINYGNGLEWWLDIPQEQRIQFIHLFKKMPIAIELETDRGQVGMVHAEIPYGMNWQNFIESIQRQDEHVIQTALWGRQRIRKKDQLGVEGIARVYVGHTPVEYVQQLKNVFYLDTGAVYGVTKDMPNSKMTFIDAMLKTELLIAKSNPEHLLDVKEQKQKLKTPFSKY